MKMSYSQAASDSSSSTACSALKAPAHAPTTTCVARHWSLCFNDRCDCTYAKRMAPTASQNDLDEAHHTNKRKRTTGLSQRASATSTITLGSSSWNFKNQWRGWKKIWETCGRRTRATREDVWHPKSRQERQEPRPDRRQTTTLTSRTKFDEQ